ncbi:MAG: TRAFs-binding domain-containing protein [Alphaproteobacteria bacterium]|nr:TRAFs-binding domain-containing protein [Alphaproteobacteria bacterium]
MNPLCFVLMPFDRKPVGSLTIDFNAVYRDLLKPAIEAAGLTPLRADEEQAGGVIHKQMFERLLLCEYALADLTGANANVYYELGVRHAHRPRSTVLVFADKALPPFDLGPLRGVQYRLGNDGSLADPEGDKAAITRFLRAARDVKKDSPLYEMLENYPNIDHEKTDIFRGRVDYSEKAKQKLWLARAQGASAIAEVEKDLGPLANLEGGVVIDLLLSYRGVASAKDPTGYEEMIRLAQAMPLHLGETAMVREQLAFAFNRVGRRQEARQVLERLIAERGPNPETNGLLGRVLKDQWDELVAEGGGPAAEAMLDSAIEAYRQGFEADWRDAYPGINAVTLMELRTPPHEDRAKLLPVVRFAVERRLAAKAPDYWDCATMLELAVLQSDRIAAHQWLGKAAIKLREGWEAETTRRNLALIRTTREKRGEDAAWIAGLEAELTKAKPSPPPPGR